MIAIENTLISTDIFTHYFCCSLEHCKGTCCIDGDAGAPLDEDEIPVLEKWYPFFKKYMREKGVQVVEEKGFFELDAEGNFVTPLIENADCAYLTMDSDGIAKCAIEKAFLAGEITYPKPISCHLYPIRISKYNDYDALNYHEWEVCKDALALGAQNSLKVFQFLKEPLIRKYGEEWYKQVEIAHNELFM
ncbi:MAG: DUF3109 family protein [Bacteroidales bacterium]